MAIHTQAWEQDLLALAYEAMHHHVARRHHEYDAETLVSAYGYCESLTALHSRSFHMASALLPKEKKRAARALYAFCRITDDIVDSAEQAASGSDSALAPNEQSALLLQQWKQRILQHHPSADDLVAVAWTDARHQYKVPHRYMEQLIDGVGRDLVQRRYATFEELAAYCYGVASTVGLMSMHIIGFASDAAIPYAIKLGVALQMTNILRDVADDFRMGRVYLPQNELEAFKLTEDDLANGVVTERWRRFMGFQIERNRQLYREALPGIKLLDGNGRFAIRAAAELYRAILDNIERRNYDVFSGRASVSTTGKLRMLPGIWVRSW